MFSISWEFNGLRPNAICVSLCIMNGPTPLPEACKLLGIPIPTGQALLRRKRELAVGWLRNRRGKPTPLVNVEHLRGAAYQGKSRVSARFANRCRMVGVDPKQALWSIVAGSRSSDGSHDLDIISDAMRFALEDGAGTHFLRGGIFVSAFLAALCGKWSGNIPKPFDIQLADYLRAQSHQHEERMPAGSFEVLWEKLIISVRKKPAWRRTKPVVVRCDDYEGRVSVRLAVVPEYERNLRGAAAFSGEPRLGDRDTRRKRSRESSEASNRLIYLAAQEIAQLIFPASGKTEENYGKSLGSALRLMRSALLFKGDRQPAVSDTNAAQALEIMENDLGIQRGKAWPFLLAYWRRATRDLLPPSASAARAAFHLKSRARTGKGPWHRPKVKFRRPTLSEEAEGLCHHFCSDALTTDKFELVTELVTGLLRLEREGKSDSPDDLAQALGYPNAGTEFARRYPPPITRAAYACIERAHLEECFGQSGNELGNMTN
jgi:hypothetical protein